MAINLYPTTINSPSIGQDRVADRGQRQPSHAQQQAIFKPEAQHVNYIPSNDSIDTLVKNAKLAKNQGVFWDRGSILNLLV